MSRNKKYIIGNWKMNLNIHKSSLYAHSLESKIKYHRDVEVVLAPTFLVLQTLRLQLNHKTFKLAAQNLYWRDEGAFTGEVSASQLHSLVDYAIIGHSERRHIFGETDKDIRAKVQAAIRNKIKPILCIGETAIERSDGETKAVLHDQLMGGLANLTSDEIEHVVIAYEPVWAIGTGNNASTQDVLVAVRSIRDQIKQLYGNKVAEMVPVVYGGSVNVHSAGDYLQPSEIDGLLIGGASLNEHEFCEIIKKAHNSMKNNDLPGGAI